MIFKFLILSDEVEDFKREIKIDGDATFWISTMRLSIAPDSVKKRWLLSSFATINGEKSRRLPW